MIIVSDTTPLISLMKAGQLNVLQNLYGEILIPEAVYNELTSNKTYREEAELIAKADFINVVQLVEKCIANTFQQKTGLDRGESEAIVYVMNIKADILLMDEALGRKVARELGIHIQGTIGVLLEAFDRKILSSDDIREAIQRLRITKRHISEQLYQYALKYIAASENV